MEKNSLPKDIIAYGKKKKKNFKNLVMLKPKLFYNIFTTLSWCQVVISFHMNTPLYYLLFPTCHLGNVVQMLCKPCASGVIVENYSF